MASYRDWMLIDNPNELDESKLKEAIKRMGNVANKRLKRMANAGVNFGEETGEKATAGVTRFSIRGKNLSELKNEFKRVRNFLSDPQSSLTGMWRTLKEVKRKWGKAPTKKMRQDFSKMEKQKKKLGKAMESKLTRYDELKRWRETWTYYNRLIQEGIWAPTEQDSNQIREIVYTQVSNSDINNLDESTTWRNILEKMKNDYEQAQIALQEEEEEDDTISTSSLISMGESD